MTWDAVGALAETLGAIAVIATLAYLAVQVRHLKSQLHMSSLKDQAEIFANVTNAVTTSPVLATALSKADRDEPLETWERRMVNGYFITWMNAFELLYNQEMEGALAIDDLSIHSVLSAFMRNESWARQFWDENRDYWPSSFQKMVDNELDRLDPVQQAER